MDLDLRKIASLMLRDYSIIAKRHYDMARDSRAIAETWRQVLDATAPHVLKSHSTQEDGKPGAPAPSPGQEAWAFVNEANEEVL